MSCPSEGCTAMTLTAGFFSLRKRLVPVTVPQVPSETKRWVIFPFGLAPDLGAGRPKVRRAFCWFSYWLGMTYRSGCALACVFARLIVPPPSCPGMGHNASATTSSSAPRILRIAFFSSGILCGTTARTGWPSAAPRAARLMPVFPDVGSTIPLPGPRAPRFSRSLSIPNAARSFTEPKGFIHSSLAYSGNPSTDARRFSRTIGDGFSASGSMSTTLS